MLSDLQIDIELPPWPENAFEAYEECAQALEDLARKAGTGSKRFHKACLNLYNLAQSGKIKKIGEILSSRIYIRALAHLWAHDTHFLEKVPVGRLLDRIKKERLSRLTLYSFIELYFNHFNKLDQKSVTALGKVIIDELEAREPQTGLLLSLFKHRQVLFHPNGPISIASHATKIKITVESVLEKMGLSQYSHTEYAAACRNIFFLETLKKLKPGQDMVSFNRQLPQGLIPAIIELDKNISEIGLPQD
jgi:hypothetical protein